MRWAAIALALSAIASTARADAIAMPASCPPSSEDAFCHGPATCRPRACIATGDCNAGEVCAARSLCVESHTCFGFPMGMLVDHVLGDCDASGACAQGTCQADFVCVSETPSVDAGRDASIDGGVVPEHVTACACRAGSGGGGLAMLSLLALAAMLTRRATR